MIFFPLLLIPKWKVKIFHFFPISPLIFAFLLNKLSYSFPNQPIIHIKQKHIKFNLIVIRKLEDVEEVDDIQIQ